MYDLNPSTKKSTSASSARSFSRSTGSNSERKPYARPSREGYENRSGGYSKPSRYGSENKSSGYESRPKFSPDKKYGGYESKPSRYSSDSKPKTSNYSSENRSSGGYSKPGGYNSSRPAGGGYRGGNGGSSYGGGRSFGGRSGGGSRYGRSGGGRSFGGGGRREDKLHHTNLVKKAKPVKIEEYEAKHKFIDFNLDERIKKNVIAKNYITPTPIQDQTIPLILEGRDVIGIANTGTGKTAAFLLPMIEKVIKDKNHRILILLPTRELANQAIDEFRSFARGLGQNCVKVIGGESIRAQMYLLDKQYNFLIGTPGRVKDLINRGNINLSKFGSVILDEVDRMVDMGFIDDMKYILAKLPEKRQSLFFSATVSKSVEVLMKTFLDDPITISVSTGQTSDNIEQDVIHIERGENKIDKMEDIFISIVDKKVIVFVKTKFGADRLDKELHARGFKVKSIHGDKSQYQRQRAIDDFKSGKCDILVATDVAARGLDIPNVTHVINFDMPATYDDYVHRIGRTGRANKTGIALTFVEGARR